MIDGLKPYPEYKQSDVPYLDRIPAEWRPQAVRRLLRPFDGIKIGPFGSQLKLEHMVSSGYKVYGQANVIAGDFMRGTKFIDDAKYKELSECEIRPGDIVVTMMGTGGRCAKVPCDAAPGVMDSHLLRLRLDIRLSPDFATVLIDRALYVKQQLDVASKGSIMQGLNSRIVKDLVLAVPPPSEQNAIVRFLDHAERQIRRYIRSRKKLIDLLNEQKQATIDRAVTRGLDPTVRLKPSGVDWLGDVPEHWVVASLRFRYHQCLGKMVDAKRTTGTRRLPYLRNVDVQWDRINTVNLPQIDITAEEHERYTVRVGDLLVCEGRHLGRAAFWRGELPTCAFQKALHRLRPRDPANDSSRYLFYCLYIVHFKDAFGASSDDNSIPHLTGEMLRAHKFPFPPSEEQRSIATGMWSAQ